MPPVNIAAAPCKAQQMQTWSLRLGDHMKNEWQQGCMARLCALVFYRSVRKTSTVTCSVWPRLSSQVGVILPVYMSTTSNLFDVFTCVSDQTMAVKDKASVAGSISKRLDRTLWTMDM